MNLLKETIEKLNEYNKTEEDVVCISDGENFMSWQDFRSKADFRYDSGFGSPEINMCLKVIGNEFWLERQEYDGSEWWEFKTVPKIPNGNGDINIKEKSFYDDF